MPENMAWGVATYNVPFLY